MKMIADAPRNNDPEVRGVLPEDYARAEIYALLGNLFYQPPSAELLETIATSQTMCNDDTDSGFCRAWRGLQQAAANADAEAVRDEFDTAFIGTGRQPVMLYGSFYLAGFLNEKPLAQLRDELTKMGLARSGDSHETEDHISALCDVMRFLIAGDQDTRPAALDAQRDFFLRNIKSWDSRLCDAVIGANQTHFYKHVAQFAREFFAIENESFDFA
jgi:TorA maturation chaperone TorD